MKTLAFGSLKGGAGKSTSSVNIAHYFATRNKKVLLIDMDNQGHDTELLGLPENNALYDLLVRQRTIADLAVNARPNLDVIGNSKDGADIEDYVSKQNDRHLLLRRELDKVKKKYDVVIIDTAPSIFKTNIVGISASDYFIAPSPMDYLNLKGVNDILGIIRDLESLGVPVPVVMGVLPTKFERVTSETRTTYEELVNTFREMRLQVLPPVPLDAGIPKSQRAGQTIWEFDPKGKAAAGYSDQLDTIRATNSMKRFGGYLHTGEILEIVFGMR